MGIRNKFIEARCGRCGDVNERFEMYYIIYKLSGQYAAIRLDLCPRCWTDLGMPKMIAKMEKEVKERSKSAK